MHTFPPEGSGRRAGRSLLHRCCVVAAAAVTAVAGLSACSDDDKSPQDSATPASRICDGALDAPAVRALERLGGTDGFEELTGKTSAGQPNRFSVSRAAAHVHDDVQLRSRCTVYKSGDTSGAPLIQVDFQATDSHPTEAAVLKEDPKAELTFYPLGVYAATSDENSTSLYFACTTKGAKGTTKYVDAGIFSTSSQLKGDSTSKDRMTILNAVSRRLATKLGCADEAHLPSSVPDGEPATS